jgi:hypothetical protein
MTAPQFTQAQIERFAERAAIIQYEANQPREIAEHVAAKELLGRAASQPEMLELLQTEKRMREG